MLNEKVILTDCDGVLLDWSYSFYKWIKKTKDLDRLTMDYNIGKSLGINHKDGHKLVNLFNKSEYMKNLWPLRDAIKYVRKLHEDHGYIFHVITSQTNDTLAQEYRKENLINIFGNVFDDITILNCGQDKDNELSKWENSDCWWIEDKAENIRAGLKFNLNPILIAHDHNISDFDVGYCRVQNWKEVYNTITGEV
jgi:hypothetical protein